MKTEQKREWLINFCLLKTQLVSEQAPDAPKLMSAADLIEISQWDEASIDKVYGAINGEVVDYGVGTDASWCPWCVLHDFATERDKDLCASCSYATRHGVCSTGSDNTYGSVRREGVSPSSTVEYNIEQFKALDPKPEPLQEKESLTSGVMPLVLNSGKTVYLKLSLSVNGDFIQLVATNKEGEFLPSGSIIGLSRSGRANLYSWISEDIGLQLTSTGEIVAF